MPVCLPSHPPTNVPLFKALRSTFRGIPGVLKGSLGSGAGKNCSPEPWEDPKNGTPILDSNTPMV